MSPPCPGSCPPGEVLISGKVIDDVKNQPGIFVRFLGRFKLKNVSRSIEVFAVDAGERSDAIAAPDPGPAHELAGCVRIAAQLTAASLGSARPCGSR